MRTFLKIFLREIRFVTADSSLYLILLGAPIVYAFMYGSIYLYKGEDHVRLALIDDDGTSISRTLTEQLESSPMIELVPAANLDEAQQEMYKGNVQGYFYIQNGLEKNILSQKQANVNLALKPLGFCRQAIC